MCMALRGFLPRTLKQTGQSVSLGLKNGILFPFSGTSGARSLFPDRFQLGGPTSVRMFKMNSIGPRDNSDFVGGDLMWAAGVSLLGPIPKIAHWPLKAHAWINAGRLTGLDSSTSIVARLEAAVTDRDYRCESEPERCWSSAAAGCERRLGTGLPPVDRAGRAQCRCAIGGEQHGRV
jgi:outer membrane protein assembly factor BamA